MDICITGGTGFIGRALVEALVEAGHHPRLLVRPGSRPRLQRRSVPGLKATAVDLLDGTALASAMGGSDAVIHLVGIIAECGSQTYEHVHVDTTRSVLDATRRAGIRRYLHMSALGTRPDSRSRYHRTKWAAEGWVRDSGLDWTVFRPSLVFGNEDQFTQFFARMSGWSPVLPVMGDGENLVQPISVENVARAFTRACTHPAAAGRVFDLCGTQRLTFAAVLRAILLARGRRRFLLRVRMPIARLIALALETVHPLWVRRPPPLNRDQLLMLEEDNVGDGSDADREFGLVHHPFADELRRQFARSLESNR